MVACGQNNGTKDVNNNDTNNVYAAGSYKLGNKEIACYWKNGTRTDLAVPENAIEASASGGIAVQGNKVYVSGFYSIDEKATACYWVNGERIDLTVPSGATTSNTNGIAILGNKVYVIGTYSIDIDKDINKWKACYWIDGTRTDLPVPAGTIGSIARVITIVGNNIYIAGSYWDDNKGTFFYWINGKITDLAIPAGPCRRGSGPYFNSPSGITVQENKVNISGNYLTPTPDGNANKMTPFYWSNGTRTDLYDDTFTVTTGIAVQGNNLYIIGYDIGKRMPCYWANGDRHYLDDFSQANSIVVQKDKVYIAGSNQGNTASYSVNGIRTDLNVPLGTRSSYASCITVVTK